MWKTVMVSVASVALTLLVIVGVAYAADIFTVDKDGTVRLVVTNSGNVGIGVADPDTLSTDPSQIAVRLGVDGTSSGIHAGAVIKAPSGKNAYLRFIPDGNDPGDSFSIGTDSADAFYVGNNTAGVWKRMISVDNTGTLNLTTTTGAILIPRLTTAQRDALTAANGMIVYNITTNAFNFRENGVWVTK